MPRSFLVKKHFNSSKKPNYSELDCPTAFVSQQLLKSLVMPVIPQPEVLSPVMYSPITMWTASDSPPSPLPTDLSPVSGYPSPKDGHEIPRSDEDEHEHEHEQPASFTFTTTTSPSGASDVTEKFRCALCHKSYSTYAGLLKHKQLHCEAHARKAFSCKYCEKEYVSLGALKMHIRTHTLPCVCKLCGKAFSRPWLLQGHIRTHTGEKPFSCSHCSRAFADRSNLRAHLQTHSDVKKYQCKNCSKTFSRMSLLHKHEESGCCVAH